MNVSWFREFALFVFRGPIFVAFEALRKVYDKRKRIEVLSKVVECIEDRRAGEEF
jgi:hypothetical protein